MVIVDICDQQGIYNYFLNMFKSVELKIVKIKYTGEKCLGGDVDIIKFFEEKMKESIK